MKASAYPEGGDFKWRILHGAIAVNVFLSTINPNISAECPLHDHKEMVFHCFSDCGRFSVLFLLLGRMFSLFGKTFSKTFFLWVSDIAEKRKLSARC